MRSDQARQNPQHSALALGLVAMVVLGGYAGWRWYQSLPKPVEYQVTVTNPALAVLLATNGAVCLKPTSDPIGAHEKITPD